MTDAPNTGAAPKGRQAAFAFVFITVVLDMLAIGIMVPVLPNLIKEFTDGDISKAAAMVGIFSAIWAGMQFLCMPVAGALSDQFGRKPIFMISNFGTAIAYALIALSPSLWFLLFARLVSGAVSASVSTAFAYVSDVEAPDRRASRFGQLGAGFSLGFLIGPAIGGWLGSIDLHLPFWVCAALSIANGIYGWLILPESLKPENRTRFSWAKANPIAAFGYLAGNIHLWPLAVVKALNDLAHTVLPSTFVLYGLYRYGWEQDMAGLTLTAVGAVGMLVQGGLTGRIVARIGERRALLLGLSCGIIAFIGYGWAPTGVIFWMVIPIASFWNLYGPSVQGLLTRRVPANEQGRLQGALASVQSAMGVLGPPVFATVFAFTIADGSPVPVPGLVLFMSGGLLTIGLALSLMHAREAGAEQKRPQGEPQIRPSGPPIH